MHSVSLFHGTLSVELIPGRSWICAASTCPNLILWICPPRAAPSLSQGSESRNVDLKTCRNDGYTLIAFIVRVRLQCLARMAPDQSDACATLLVLPDWDRLRHFWISSHCDLDYEVSTPFAYWNMWVQPLAVTVVFWFKRDSPELVASSPLTCRRGALGHYVVLLCWWEAPWLQGGQIRWSEFAATSSKQHRLISKIMTWESQEDVTA